MAKKQTRTSGETVARIAARMRLILGVLGALTAAGLVVGLRFQLDLIATTCSGVLAVSLTLYAFVRLWPQPKGEEETARRVEDAKALVTRVQTETKGGPLRVRKGHVKLSQRATQVLAMTIKGMMARDREKR
jgi:hypothetical protein